MFQLIAPNIKSAFAVKYCMKKAQIKALAVFAAAALSIVVAAVLAALPFCSRRLAFSAVYYLVCYKSADDAHSAGSVSSTVQSYGGAGYIVRYGNEYFVVVACYYDMRDAEEVRLSLKQYELDCRVVEAYAGGYALPVRLSARGGDIEGWLRTLDETGRIFYNAANAADGGNMAGGAAASVLSDARMTLCAVMEGNADNALGDEAGYIIALIDDLDASSVSAREFRVLQAAVCDCLINLRFV